MELTDSSHIDKVCRSCLGEKSEMLSLFTVYDGPVETNSLQYSGMFLASTAIRPQRGDGLPGSICEQCRVMLVQAYCFKAMCERADARLRALTGAAPTRSTSATQTEGGACLQMYNCPQCQKKFKGLGALQRHCVRHEGQEGGACSTCGALCRDRGALEAHEAEHHTQGGYELPLVKREPPSHHRVIVKEEPMDDVPMYHEEEEDTTQEEYLLPPIKQEFPPDTHPMEVEKRKPSKKKSKREAAHTTLEKHPCTVCPRVFSSQGHLKAHEEKHQSKGHKYPCPGCDQIFSRSAHLKRHQGGQCPGTGATEVRVPCPQCPRVFLSQGELERHEKLKHQVAESAKVAFCSLCDRGFTTQRYLDIHMKSHTGEGGHKGQGFPCKACEHVSESKVEARAHTQWHRRVERPFLCSECGQGFTRDAYLTVHMRRHRGEKPFSCSFCGKGFPRRSDLDIHERYHTEDKRHKCAICGKAFHRQYNLKVHLRVHTGERPYACTYCPKAFTQPNDLKAHVRRHTGERFTCEVCGAQFLHGYHLTQHRRAVHAVDKPSHIRRLSKFPAASGVPPPPHAPPTRGRARQAHIDLAAHMASILAAQTKVDMT